MASETVDATPPRGTMASETVDPIYWSHPPPAWAVERLVHSINNRSNMKSGTQWKKNCFIIVSLTIYGTVLTRSDDLDIFGVTFDSKMIFE